MFQKKLTPAALLVSLTLISACASVVTPTVSTEAAALRKGDYRLDPAHASLLFKINHLGYSAYVGRFERFDVTLDFDAKAPEKSKIEAAIDMNSLDIANDEFANTLMGPDWFDVSQYPQARFVSREIVVTGETSGIMTGDLTLHGQTEKVALDVTFNGGGRDLLRGAYITGFSATATIDRTDFGVSKFSGVITNEVMIEIEAELIRQ